MSNIIPQSICAGLTFGSLVTLTAYPAPTWALTVALRGAASIDLTATAEGAQHRLAAAATTTAAWTPGDYWYSARVSGPDGELVEVESGSIRITPDIAQAGPGFDGRSHARKTLDAIKAVIEKRATIDQERYTINNRELWRTPVAELLKFRSLYEAEVRRENMKARGQNLFGQQVKVTI